MRHWRKGQYFLVCSRQLRRVVGFFFFFLHDSCCCEFISPPPLLHAYLYPLISRGNHDGRFEDIELMI